MYHQHIKVAILKTAEHLGGTQINRKGKMGGLAGSKVEPVLSIFPTDPSPPKISNPHQLSPQDAALLSSSDIAMPVSSSLWSLVWYNSCKVRL